MALQTTLDAFLIGDSLKKIGKGKDYPCRLLIVSPSGEYGCLICGMIYYPETCQECPFSDQRLFLLKRYAKHPLCYFCQTNLGIRQGFLGSSKRIYTCFWCYERLNREVYRKNPTI